MRQLPTITAPRAASVGPSVTVRHAAQGFAGAGETTTASIVASR